MAWCSAHVTGVMNSVCDRIIEQFLPDIVDGLLAGGALSIAVRNLDPDAPVTVAASIDSGNQSWLSGATPGHA